MRFLLFGLFLLFISLSSYSYQFTSDFELGFYWGSFPIKMKRFAASHTEGNRLESLVREAEKEWEDAVGVDLWEFEDGYDLGSSFGGNYIRWSHNFGAETGFDPKTTLAIAIRRNEGSLFSSTEIILNSSIGYLWNNEDGALKQTILHEMGHTIGLDHSDFDTVMSSSMSYVSTLQEDDITGMNALVNETKYRQRTGYQVELGAVEAQEKDELIAACGSIDPTDSSGLGFMISLLLGMIMTVLFTQAQKLAWSAIRLKIGE